MSLFSSVACPKKQNLPGIENITADTIKVLAIGNSFSQDALEFYLSGLARAAGIPIVIGNLSIGGASLALHWDNASNDKAVYAYRKINAEGKRESRSNVTISEALSDQDWDFVSFQQVSQNAGRFETFIEPLPMLYSYVQEKLQGKETKFVFHQTWAYAQNTTHGGFKQYNRNQLEMYHAIVEVSKRVKELVPIDIVVPSGTAIQNGRTSVIGDNFCRDGFHLDVNIGRYTAAATWFEVISGKSVIGNTFKPEASSANEVEIAQQAAHAAVLNPYKITELAHYKK
ncbi:DUF4886 domain-containing protein [Sphingobacterium chuzhouense]|uniref:DUF4886 domain-containing protein n=2 Tax=Sphingobacterium chuzhouense TaxID=1742264 RepID=A0ABR7XT20_9SPHI|nr:DUF4886 domain-containing protein [Sphingobacterium chuzhouense]